MDSRSVPAGPRQLRRTPNLDEEIPPDEEATVAQPDTAWASMGSTRVVESLSGEPPTSPESPDSEAATEITRAEKRQQVSTLGDYRLVKKVGEGAMGAVYKAQQISCEREVALKILFPHIANNPKLVERLYREGMVMGQLDHPNIVQAFGIGEDQGWHYVAMEFVEGVSLQKWLERRGRFSVGDALHITLAVARALEYAHQLGVVHRDIKPDNVLIGSDGSIKVTDLGMVKRMDEDMSLTDTGHAVGTPWYMPLEQAKNAKDTDGRSDLYALGCLLYCLLVGHPPFGGKSLVEVIQSKEAGTFPPARRFNPDVPERLDLIIAKMAAKLPKVRHQTAAEVVQDLENLGLANTALEFPHVAQAGPSHRPASSSAIASDLEDQPAASSADKPLDPNLWFVRVKNEDGQAVLRKMTTSQIQKLLEEGQLDPIAKASHTSKEGFRALAAIKEFEGGALTRASKRAADKQSIRYRNIYKQIEEKELQRAAEVKPNVSNSAYWFGIGWRWAALAGGIIFVILLLSWFATGLGGSGR